MSSNKKLVLRNFFWLFFDKIVKSLGNFILNLQIIIYLSIYDYGLVNLGISFGLFVFAFLQFYREIVVKEYAVSKNSSTDFDICMSSIFLRLLTLLIFFTAIQISNIGLLPKIIVTSVLLNFSDIPEFFWQAKGKVHKIIIIRCIVFIFTALLKIYLLTHNYTINYFASTYIIESILNSIISIVLLRYDLEFHQIQLRKLVEKSAIIFKSSLPLLFTGLLTISYMRIDQIIIKENIGEIYLGKYVFALNVAEILQAVPYMFGLAIAPSMFQENDRKILLSNTKKSMTYLLVAGIVLIPVSVVFFAHLSAKYQVEDVKYIFLILGFGSLPTFMSYIATKYLILTNQINHFLVRGIYACVLSMGFNLFFIDSLGLYAPAIAYFTVQWYIGFFSNYFLRKDKDLFKIQIDAIKSLFLLHTYVDIIFDVKKTILAKR